MTPEERAKCRPERVGSQTRRLLSREIIIGRAKGKLTRENERLNQELSAARESSESRRKHVMDMALELGTAKKENDDLKARLDDATNILKCISGYYVDGTGKCGGRAVELAQEFLKTKGETKWDYSER